MLSKNIYISPIIPGPGRSHHLDGLGQERDELSIPAAHLAAGVPKGSEDGVELAPAVLLEGLDEFIALALGGGGPDDLELRCEAGVYVVVVFYRVADVEDSGFGHFVYCDWDMSIMLIGWVGLDCLQRQMHED